MTLSLAEWHHRFQQQARWTRDLRSYIFKHIELPSSANILEVGSGTGAILTDSEIPHIKFGLDIDLPSLLFSNHIAPSSIFTCGDGHTLPYSSNAFDLSLCHFLLLWCNSPAQVLRQMIRVTKPAGFVLALAEPDYGGRIDYPELLSRLGTEQTMALRQQGADPLMGRKLASHFHSAGLQSIESGVIGAQWQSSTTNSEFELEWLITNHDLHSFLDSTTLSSLHELEKTSRENGSRTLFIPTFYAIGRVPPL